MRKLWLANQDCGERQLIHQTCPKQVLFESERGFSFMSFWSCLSENTRERKREREYVRKHKRSWYCRERSTAQNEAIPESVIALERFFNPCLYLSKLVINPWQHSFHSGWRFAKEPLLYVSSQGTGLWAQPQHPPPPFFALLSSKYHLVDLRGYANPPVIRYQTY